MKSETDALGLSPKPEYELALSSLGACVFYLKKCLVDFEVRPSFFFAGTSWHLNVIYFQVLSMGQFKFYESDNKSTNMNSNLVNKSFPLPNQRLILDSVTLANLEILENNKGSK